MAKEVTKIPLEGDPIVEQTESQIDSLIETKVKVARLNLLTQIAQVGDRSINVDYAEKLAHIYNLIK